MTTIRNPDGRAGIDADLVKRLIASQFPQWKHLQVEPVEVDGWDNRTYRLGADKTVRLPTDASYAPAIEKEHQWLPVLARGLPAAIPEPLGLGIPGEGYPHPWSVRRWIDGETAFTADLPDLPRFATEVAEFITALQRADADRGPAAGAHSFYRGSSLLHYDTETREALAALEDRVDTAACAAVWESALAAAWEGPPVWFHGDVAPGNLLVRDGRLHAVIDFGTSGVGDPASDLVIAWTMFEGTSREAFREAVGQDAGTWARARGWAVWKALICLAGVDPNHGKVAPHHRVIKAVTTEHSAGW